MLSMYTFSRFQKVSEETKGFFSNALFPDLERTSYRSWCSVSVLLPKPQKELESVNGLLFKCSSFVSWKWKFYRCINQPEFLIRFQPVAFSFLTQTGVNFKEFPQSNFSVPTVPSVIPYTYMALQEPLPCLLLSCFAVLTYQLYHITENVG